MVKGCTFETTHVASPRTDSSSFGSKNGSLPSKDAESSIGFYLHMLYRLNDYTAMDTKLHLEVENILHSRNTKSY